MAIAGSHPVQHLRVDPHDAGQRIDNYLLALDRSIPKSRIYRALRTGEVRVNKGRVKPTYKLQTGDEVRIPPLAMRIRNTEAAHLPPALERVLKASILFEDADFMVINKPPGLPVHAGTQVELGLIEYWRLMQPQCPFLELVHRLDRDTSGCLMIAKSRASLVALQQQMKDHAMDKHYLTLLKGHWTLTEHTVELPLLKNQLQGGERMVQVDPLGKTARTLFITRERLEDASFCEAVLFTGRTHQIRVHAASQGHPVAGDDKYGDRAWNKALRAHGLKRIFLHASRLQIRHPISQEPMEFVAPLSPDLSSVLHSLSA